MILRITLPEKLPAFKMAANNKKNFAMIQNSIRCIHEKRKILTQFESSATKYYRLKTMGLGWLLTMMVELSLANTKVKLPLFKAPRE